MKILKMKDIDLKNKKVLIRLDLNVPIKNKKITSSARIKASLPTIKLALKKKAKIIIISHLGRPKEGRYCSNHSLLPIVKYMSKKLPKIKIHFLKKIKSIKKIKKKSLLILENVRFNIGEKKNDILLAKKYANLCDVFVMDAFGTAHRKEASTYGVMKFAKISCAGPLLVSEIKALKKAIKNPKRPLVTILGGSKISTKFKLLKKLSKVSDTIITGGGIANTFLAIKNNIGKSIFEKEYIKLAKKLLHKYNIIIPTDSKLKILKNKKKYSVKTKKIYNIKKNEEIMDIGKKSIKKYKKIIKKAKTIIWNGPVGVFENKKFRKGTKKIAHFIAKNSGFSLAGGGDTLAVIEMFNIKKNISYISTGGGAFLKFIESGTLPIIKMLKQVYNKKLLREKYEKKK
ncbi:phosphoglycerate kinase [Buchnera aphidicola]|uniref:phosphoglycerate kinase n=1 Tax=Buchnera aphidicola TaxID=9 RepID=UPI0030EF19A4